MPLLWEPSDRIGWVHKPNLRETVKAGDVEVAFCTDSRGDRVECDAAPSLDCGSRVLVIGDSFVEALSVPYRDTVWSHLQRELGACIEVSGVGGYEMGQYLAVARERLPRPGAHYDLVILNFYAGNDFTMRATRVPPSSTVGRFARDRDTDEPASSGFGSGIAIWLGARSHAFVAAVRAVEAVDEASDAEVYFGWRSPALRRSTLHAKMIRETARGIRLVGEQVELADARLLVVLIPHWAQVMDPKGNRLVELLPKLGGDVDMDLVTREFAPRVRALPHVDDVVDLVPLFRERADPSLWASDYHFSAAGHQLWLEALREPVRRLLPDSRARLSAR